MCVVMSVIHGFDVPRSGPVSSQGVMPLFGVNPFYVPLDFKRSFGSRFFMQEAGLVNKPGVVEVKWSQHPGIF